MTEIIELLPLPLYPTEEMKRAGMERMAQAQRDGSASLYAYAAVCWEAMVECYREDAAPAEDVRAVVEEPVRYADMKRYLHTPRYRRPVVLPERTTDNESCSALMKKIGMYGDVNIWQGGKIWNACLDEVERLNK